MKTEHIDDVGRLRVPVQFCTDEKPERKGWRPFWVDVNLDGHTDWEGKPQMIVGYIREPVRKGNSSWPS